MRVIIITVPLTSDYVHVTPEPDYVHVTPEPDYVYLNRLYP